MLSLAYVGFMHLKLQFRLDGINFIAKANIFPDKKKDGIRAKLKSQDIKKFPCIRKMR